MHSRILRAAAAVALTTALPAAAEAYTIGRCTAEAEAAFDRLQIDRSTIARASTDTQAASEETRSQLSGVNIWLKTAGCTGSLVVVLGGDCRFIGTFTTGDCDVGDFRR